MDRMPDREVAEIHLDKFGQVVRQTADVEVVHDVVRHATLLLHAGRNNFV